MKRSLLLFGLGTGIGYVLGARAGREQYDRLVGRVRLVWDDPRVSRARRDVETYARTQAPIVAERAQEFADAVPGKVTEGVQKAAENAADVVGRTTVVAQDVAGRTRIVATDARRRVETSARAAAAKAQDVVRQVRSEPEFEEVED